MKIHRVLFCIFILSFSFSLVSADLPSFDYRMIKWNMCNTFNLTEYNCDAWWEDSLNPYYVETESEDLSNYYNASQINNLFSNYYNKTQVKQISVDGDLDLNLSGYYNKSETLDLINESLKDFKKSLLINNSDYITREDLQKILEDDDSEISDQTLLVILFVILAGAGGLYYYNSKNKKEETYNRDVGVSPISRIHSRKKSKDKFERKIKEEVSKSQTKPTENIEEDVANN